MNRKILLPLFLLSLFFAQSPLYGQLSIGGTPYSLRPEGKNLASAGLKPVVLEAPDMKTVLEEDKHFINQIRFAVPIEVDIQLARDGQWTTLPNGDRIWQLAIKAPGAKGLAVCYEDYHLPYGATLYHFTENGRQVLGGYTELNNQKSGKLFTGITRGETAILEYYEPRTVSEKGNFKVFKIYYVYKNDFENPETPVESNNMTGFGSSFPCQVNINCPAGNNWQDEKRGVVRILMAFQEGLGLCSGSLVNNTANDGTPYMLTAFHCQEGFTPLYDMWTFYFNYESPNCNNPANEPALQSVTGCAERAGRQATDFLLVELTDNPPTAFNAYFNGWNRSATPASTTTTMIHHPLGDIKKISVDLDSSVIWSSINWGPGNISPAGSHIKSIPDIGTFQQGSSGSAVFDQNGRIIAQFHGGTWNPADSCQATSLFHGRFAISWDQGSTPDTRLKEWLDPGNTAPVTLNGIENPVIPVATLTGNVKTAWNIAMPNLRVIKIIGTDHDTAWTNANGDFSFTNVPLGSQALIFPVRDSAQVNGVTTFDLVKIQRHILGLEFFNTPFKHLSADANGSNSVTAFDLIKIRKMILFIDTTFSPIPSWKFVPVIYTFPNPNNPFANLPIPDALSVNVTSNVTGLNFYGTKTGDVNESAN